MEEGIMLFAGVLVVVGVACVVALFILTAQNCLAYRGMCQRSGPAASWPPPETARWRPIDREAMGRGEVLLAWTRRGPSTARRGWYCNPSPPAIGVTGWWVDGRPWNGGSPTHWMPLPAGPDAEEHTP